MQQCRKPPREYASSTWKSAATVQPACKHAQARITDTRTSFRKRTCLRSSCMSRKLEDTNSRTLRVIRTAANGAAGSSSHAAGATVRGGTAAAIAGVSPAARLPCPPLTTPPSCALPPWEGLHLGLPLGLAEAGTCGDGCTGGGLAASWKDATLSRTCTVREGRQVSTLLGMDRVRQTK